MWKSSNLNKAWSMNGKLYCENSDGFYIWDFDSHEKTKIANKDIDYLGHSILGPDQCLYSFILDESISLCKLYRIDLSEENPVWKLVSHMFKVKKAQEILFSENGMYVRTSADNDWAYINTFPQGEQKRTSYRYEYNAYKQPVKTVTTTYNVDNGVFETQQYTETNSYVDKHNAPAKRADRLGNTITYTYDNSPYYIPTTVKVVYKGGPTITTTNTLLESSNDKLNRARISSSSTLYAQGMAILSEYEYSGSAPGNVIQETSTEIKNGVSTQISKVDYQYDTPAEAYISQTETSGVTNNENFSEEKLVDLHTRYTYYEDTGLKKSETDAENRTTSYEYNNNGWLTKTNYPDGTFTQITYDINGTDNSVTTSYNDQYYTVNRYDGLGVLASNGERNEQGEEKVLKSFVYQNGQLTRTTDALGNQTCYEYDVYDRVIFAGILNPDQEIGDNFAVTDLSVENLNPKFQQYTRVSYNDYERTMTVSEGADENITKTYYDEMGREKKVSVNTDAGVFTTTTTYDPMGRVSTASDAKGTTYYTYNTLGQLLAVRNPAMESTTYTYDSYGNVKTVTTAGGSVTNYSYDDLGRLLSVTDPEGQTAYYAYDNVGKLLRSKDRSGETAIFNYDSMDRMTSQIKGETSVAYDFDSLGNLTAMTDETGTTAYSYTYNNLLKSITTPDDYTITYEYDDAQNIRRVKDYSQRQFDYTYTAANQLETITRKGNIVASYAYSKAGNIISQTTPEGTSVYTYGQGGRLKNLVNSTASTAAVNSYSYEYDTVGNQTKKTDNGQITQYTYDSLSRLSRVQEPDGTSTAYTFDQNNNIMTKSVTHPASYSYGLKQDGIDYELSGISVDNTTYAYDANNRLLEETRYIGGDSETYSGFIEVTSQNTYDANGNLLKTEKGGQVDSEVVEYEYDELNRLVHYTDAAGQRTNYKYNGQNQRMRKWTEGTTTYYYWDRGYISNERGRDSWISANYVGLDGIFARETKKNAEEVSYMMKDGHGNVTSVIQDGTVTKTYDYDAYGVEKNPDPNDTNPFRYCGEYFDQETQNIYLRNRYYNPSNGRFITEDAHWNPSNMIYGDDPENTMPSLTAILQSSNLYGYCRNNPISYIDPLGLYDRWAAVDYAKKWWGPSEYRRNPEYYNYRQDCTNFVSQCLFAGGIVMNSSWHSYYYPYWPPGDQWQVAEPWRLAKNQFEFFSNPYNGYIYEEVLTIWSPQGVSIVSNNFVIQPGDLLYWANADNMEPYHAGMVSHVENGEIYFTAHDSPRFDEPLSIHINSGEVVFVIRIRDEAVRGYCN